ETPPAVRSHTLFLCPRNRLILARVDYFCAAPRAQGLHDWHRQAVREEFHRPIREAKIGASGMLTAEHHKAVVLVHKEGIRRNLGGNEPIDRPGAGGAEQIVKTWVLIRPCPATAVFQLCSGKDLVSRIDAVAFAEEEGVTGTVLDIRNSDRAIDVEDAV